MIGCTTACATGTLSAGGVSCAALVIDLLLCFPNVFMEVFAPKKKHRNIAVAPERPRQILRNVGNGRRLPRQQEGKKRVDIV